MVNVVALGNRRLCVIPVKGSLQLPSADSSKAIFLLVSSHIRGRFQRVPLVEVRLLDPLGLSLALLEVLIDKVRKNLEVWKGGHQDSLKHVTFKMAVDDDTRPRWKLKKVLTTFV